MSISQSGRTKIIKYGILAGVAGGSAEVIWIAAFGILANISAVNVAYGVVAVVGLEISSAALGVLAGVAIHMAAAITLGIAVAAGCHALMGPWRLQKYFDAPLPMRPDNYQEHAFLQM